MVCGLVGATTARWTAVPGREAASCTRVKLGQADVGRDRAMERGGDDDGRMMARLLSEAAEAAPVDGLPVRRPPAEE